MCKTFLTEKLLVIGVFSVLLGVGAQAFAQSKPETLWTINQQLGDFKLAFAFSPNEPIIAVGFQSGIRLLNVSDGIVVRAFPDARCDLGNGWNIPALTFSPDGRNVASAHNYIVEGFIGLAALWDPADATLSDTFYPEVDRWVLTVALSRDNTLLAFGTTGQSTFGYPGEVHLVSLPDGTERPSCVEQTNAVNSVTFSPDSRLLACGSRDQTVKVWCLSNAMMLLNLTNHTDSVNSVAVSPDGRLLASASSDGTTRLWRLPDGAPLRVLESGVAFVVRFTPDSKHVLTGGDTIKLWRTTNGRLLYTYDENAVTLEISPGGNLFAYGQTDGTLVMARMPLLITDIVRSGNLTVLRWTGGTGQYQVQQSTNLSTGSWQNIGATTTATSATNSTPAPVFYRVQSLP